MERNIYEKIYSLDNLEIAFRKAKTGKSKRRYVKRFQSDLKNNLLKLREELVNQTYQPNKLKTFILRDPKTRKISKSAFRDRVVHNAVCNVISPDLEKSFIYDSHANQIGKGTLKAIERFDYFKRKVSKNNTRECFVLKADIKHYFEEIDHDILINIIKRKIDDEKTIWLIKQILANVPLNRGGGRTDFDQIKGMPLGNLTSQSFANVYLNELDQFVKHKLRAKYYIRYVDDFVILHNSKKQLEIWKEEISKFLKEKLKIELHPSKSKILRLENGATFLGFRIFFNHKLLRKSNIGNFERKFNQMKILFDEGFLEREKAVECFEGWLSYASHGNTFKYRKNLVKMFSKNFPCRKEPVKNQKNYINFQKKITESDLKFAVQKTLFLYRKRMSIEDIALNEGVKESTIWAHLINLIEHKQIHVSEVISKEKRYKILRKIYRKNEGLKDIKKRLSDSSITYDEIACVMAGIKSRIKKVS